jgi:hypothetical protein
MVVEVIPAMGLPLDDYPGVLTNNGFTESRLQLQTRPTTLRRRLLEAEGREEGLRKTKSDGGRRDDR